MSKSSVGEQDLCLLKDTLNVPLVKLDVNDPESTVCETRKSFEISSHCCIVAISPETSNKFQNIKNLYQNISELQKIQKKIHNEYSLIHESVIGIYPSAEAPVFVYELNTEAESYVNKYVLPYESSTTIKLMKKIVGKIIGVNPVVGSLGLLLQKE